MGNYQHRIEIVHGFETHDAFTVTANVGTVLKSERVTFLREKANTGVILELHRNRSVGAQWRPVVASRHALAVEAFKIAEEV